MLRFAIGLCSLVCLARAAPTVHLGEQTDDVYEYSTELPQIVDPIYVTTRPLVDTSYVNPINTNYIPTIAPPVQQPVNPVHQHLQPQPDQPYQPYQPQQPQVQYYYYHPTHVQQPYNIPSYQMHPSFGYQWQDTVPLHQQHPISQPTNTNVLPCNNARHYGGYQLHGY